MEKVEDTNSEPENLKTLELLVEELMKEAPEEKLVKSYMLETGLEYSEDQFGRINTVLKALHFDK